MKVNKFTHLDEKGKAKMVNISGKEKSCRTAEAVGYIFLDKNIIKKIKENQIQKGDVLTVSKIAGISAAKKTFDLIPLCHQIKLTSVNIEFKIVEEENKIEVKSIVSGFDRSGMEMEALTSVSIGLLAIYDMCKALSKNMKIGEIELVRKTGGKSDYIKQG